jgi:hypothetical protein
LSDLRIEAAPVNDGSGRENARQVDAVADQHLDIRPSPFMPGPIRRAPLSCTTSARTASIYENRKPPDCLTKARECIDRAKQIAGLPLPQVAAGEACLTVFHVTEAYIFESNR